MSDMDDLRDAGYSVDSDDYSWLDREPQDEVYTVSDYYDECWQTAEDIVSKTIYKFIDTNKNINKFLLIIDLSKESELDKELMYKYYISIYGIHNLTNHRIKVGETESFIELAYCMDIAETIADVGNMFNVTIKHVYKKIPELERLLIELKKDRDFRFEEKKKKYLLTCQYDYNNFSVFDEGFWNNFNTVNNPQSPY